MNCGCRRAVDSTRVYVECGIVAQRDWGEEAWRSRQMYSISFGGRARILGTSMKEDRVLIPGGVEGLTDSGHEEEVVDPSGEGGGGGLGKGESGEDDVELIEDGFEEGGEGMAILAAFFWFSILSLYAAFNSPTSFRPSLHASLVAPTLTSGFVTILFRLSVQLIPIFFKDTIRVPVGCHKAHIVDLGPSSLKSSKIRRGSSNDITEGRKSKCYHKERRYNFNW